MTTDIIEGTATEVEPERALVVAQPGQALVAQAERPAGMIAVATALADALKNIIDRQHLYTEIRGKRYPQVEAWMTIGRLDNVVAREAERPIRNEDGSYEGFVELIRLSDGMVIGRASALCGMADDEPWGGTPARNGKSAQPPRAEYARRSMAVTRATSRAFRQQYSWIMALAGYEPTPADEMPDANRETHPPTGLAQRYPGIVETEAHPAPDDLNLIGTAVTDGQYDFGLRQLAPDPANPEAPKWKLPFRVKNGSKSFIVVAEDRLAETLAPLKDEVIGKRVQVWGTWRPMTTPAKGTKPEVHYRILVLERIATPDFTLPAPAWDNEPIRDAPPDDIELAGEAETAPLGLVS